MAKRNFNGSKLRLFFSYITPYRGMFALDMVLATMVSVIDLVFPYVTRMTMNTLLPENAFGTFFTVMGIFFAAYIIKSVLYYFVVYVGHNVGVKAEADMRADLFEHMQELSYSYYDKNRTGALLARVTTDLFEISELAHHGPENLLTCSLTIIGALVILMHINVTLSLVLVVLLPICIGFLLWSRKKMQETNTRVKQETGGINSAIESSISGIRTSKAFANEIDELRKFKCANDDYKSAKRQYYKWMGVFNGGLEAYLGIMQVAVIAIGGWLIMRGELNYVDLLTFTLYVSTFMTPFRKLAQSMEMFAQGTAGYERFLQIMRIEPKIKDDPDAVELKDVKGHVEYRDVSFSYDNGTEVLKDINMDIPAGKTFAMVGPSGGGKTTICHLLPRFYEPTKGAIYIDGININKVTQKSLRLNIGIIQQDVFLFAGTVRDNIRYGRPNATDDEIVEAAKKAEMHDEIMSFPDGYDTFVGERGVVLSGGQKQRISIARVFLKNPPILVLDEATSALDSVTERRIQESLDRLSVGKTAIIIAHRLSTVRGADCIAVVEDEHIIEQGTRDELLEKNGVYASLEAAQQI